MTIRNAEIVEALRNAMPEVLPIQTFREDEDFFAAQRIFLRNFGPYPFLLTARKQKNGRILLRFNADAYFGLFGVNCHGNTPTAYLTAAEFLNKDFLVDTITTLAEEKENQFTPRIPVTHEQLKDYDKMVTFTQTVIGHGTPKDARNYLAVYGMNR